MNGGRPPTDFSRYPHAILIQILADTDPDGLAATGQAWDDLGRGLYERAAALSDHSARLQRNWAGGAAARHRAMIGDLRDRLCRIAGAAHAVRDLVHAAGDALRTAHRLMPAEAGPAAHHDAVCVMAWLAARYRAITAALPAALPAASPVGAPTTSCGPDDPRPPGATAGEATRQQETTPPAEVGDDGGTGGGAGITGGPGSAGGGGALAGAFPGAAAGRLGTASAPPPAGAAQDPAAYRPAGLVGAATGDAAPGGRGIGAVPPMMPMGMMAAGAGGAAGGGGRGTPPWLVDSEDVWGEVGTVVPAVLGE